MVPAKPFGLEIVLEQVDQISIVRQRHRPRAHVVKVLGEGFWQSPAECSGRDGPLFRYNDFIFCRGFPRQCTFSKVDQHIEQTLKIVIRRSAYTTVSVVLRAKGLGRSPTIAEMGINARKKVGSHQPMWLFLEASVLLLLWYLSNAKVEDIEPILLIP